MQLTQTQKEKLRKILEVQEFGDMALLKLLVNLEEKVEEIPINTQKDLEELRILLKKGRKTSKAEKKKVAELTAKLLTKEEVAEEVLKRISLEEIAKKVPKPKDGKDAVVDYSLLKKWITDNTPKIDIEEIKEEIAEELREMIPSVPEVVDNIPIVGEKVRDALELIYEEDDKLKMSAVGKLPEKIKELETKIEKSNARGGGIAGINRIAEDGAIKWTGTGIINFGTGFDVTTTTSGVEVTVDATEVTQVDAAGNNTEIQLNVGGILGTDPNFTYDPDTDIFNVGDSSYDVQEGEFYLENTDLLLSGGDLNIATTNYENGFNIDYSSDEIKNDAYLLDRYTSGSFRLYGGEITDNGDGTITVSAGKGMVHTVDGDPEGCSCDTNSAWISPMKTVTWEETIVTPTDDAYNYIYYDYETDAITSTTDFYSISFHREFTVGRVYRSGTTITERLCGTNAWAFDKRVQLFGEEYFPVVRAKGLALSETGTRNIGITAGVLWAELVNRFSTDAFDSSGTDRFTYWYYNGTAWASVTSQSQIDNTQYNDITSGLATLTAQRYGVHWVYVVHDSSVHVVYGQGDYTLLQAEATTPPSSLPGLLGAYATLIGRIIIQKSASTFYEINSAFTTTLSTSGVTSHADLSNLVWGSSGHTGDANNIPFFNSSGLADTSSTFVYDKTNGRLGIGVSDPDSSLEVKDTFKVNIGANNLPITISQLSSSANLLAAAGSLYLRGGSGAGMVFQVNASTEGMRIQSDGKVGVKIASPTADSLSVYGTSDEPSLIASDSILSVIGSATNQLSIGSSDASPYGMWLQTKNTGNESTTYPLLLNPIGGNVGIGTTAPDEKFVVTRGGAYNNVKLVTGTNGYGDPVAYATTGDGDKIYLLDTAAVKTAIGANGANGIWLQGSTADASKLFSIWNSGTSAPGTPAEKFTVLGDGKVGIGTTTPEYKLHVYTNSDAIQIPLLVENASTGSSAQSRMYFKAGSAQTTFNQFGSGHSTEANNFQVSSAGKIYLISGGSTALTAYGSYIGVGMSGIPGATLDVRGSAVFNEDGGDFDFRVEGDNNANLIMADAGLDSVGIGAAGTSGVRLNVSYSHDGSTNYEAAINALNDVILTTNRTGNFQYGLNFTVQKRGNYNFGQMRGILSTPYIFGSGAVSGTYGIYAQGPSFRDASATGSVTNGFVFYGNSPTQIGGATGTVGTMYGLYLADMKTAFTTTGYSIYSTGASDTAYFAGALDLRGSAVFNEGGEDKDFRIEGDSKTHLFFLDASTDRIGINQSTPTAILHLKETAKTNAGALTIEDSDTTNKWSTFIDASDYLTFQYNSTDADFWIRSGYGIYGTKVNAQSSNAEVNIIGTSSAKLIFDLDTTYDDYFSTNGAGTIQFYSGGNAILDFTSDGIVPSSDGNRYLGSPSFAFGYIYTYDLNCTTLYVNGSSGYTGDLNDSTSTKIADVVGGIITAVYY